MRRSMAVVSIVCTSTLVVALPRAQDGSAAARIPLCAGLTIVTAVAQRDGDYESIKTIESVDATQIRLKYSVEKMQYPGLFDDKPPVLRSVVIHRTMLAADLATATNYQQRFMEKSVDTIPGTTAIGTSTAVIKALRRTGAAQMGISGAGEGAWTWTADKNKTPNYYQYLTAAKLTRVSKAPVMMPVLVNDTVVDLPAIHATGDALGEKVEFFFLDDERNPLTLAFRIGIDGVTPLSAHARETCQKHPDEARVAYRCDLPDGGDKETLRVVKIAYRCAAPGTLAGESADAGAVERALVEKGSVDIYDIHFSFNSDAIREESEPTLTEIADVLRRHPAWKLRITGHTDGIGSPQYNVDLSTRRAAAVRTALVTRHAIGGSRLSAAGVGESQPKDTNDTLEGRARNRRVELKRHP